MRESTTAALHQLLGRLAVFRLYLSLLLPHVQVKVFVGQTWRWCQRLLLELLRHGRRDRLLEVVLTCQLLLLNHFEHVKRLLVLLKVVIEVFGVRLRAGGYLGGLESHGCRCIGLAGDDRRGGRHHRGLLLRLVRFQLHHHRWVKVPHVLRRVPHVVVNLRCGRLRQS